MTIGALMWTRLEKAAFDNGFDIAGARVEDWRIFTSSQTRLRIWLTSVDDAQLVVAMSSWRVCNALEPLGSPWSGPLPPGAQAARSVHDLPTLHQLVRRAFQLSRAVPDEPLRLFASKTAKMPKTTEAERMAVQRVGQDIFRAGLIDYWEGRCAVTGLAVVELLRASHIKPWAECATDAERLDVYNGLLLAPHLDAAFDRGFITVDDNGRIVVSDALDAHARGALGLDSGVRLLALADAHRVYLEWHRARVFEQGLSQD